MKVMHLLPSLTSGGVEQVVLELCQGLCQRGVECVVVSAGGPMVKDIEAAGARHITRAIEKKSFKTFFQVGKVAALLRKERPDILHLHSRVPAWVGHFACKRLRPKDRPAIVSTFHGFHSVGFYSSIMSKGDRIVAVSDCMREHILQNYPKTPAESICVIPNSVDTSLYYPGFTPSKEWWGKWRADYPELVGKYTLCLPGRITRLKGADQLIPILVALKAQDIPAHAVVVGETKRGKEQVKEEFKESFRRAGLADAVTWTGLRYDMREVLSACDVTLSLALQPESFSKTTLEALALGRPVAGYEHGGVGEQLDVFLPEGKVPPENPAAMAALLAKWYRNRPVPMTTVPSPYRREDMVESHLALYRELRP